VLSKPTLFPVPAFGVRLAFGEMGDALLLSSARVTPGVLQHFAYPTLDAALRHILDADKRG
jgi:NAD dependent epimerase/dehydratase family enzyme